MSTERDALAKRLAERRSQLDAALRDVQVLPLVIADLEAALGVPVAANVTVSASTASTRSLTMEHLDAVIVQVIRRAGENGVPVRQITDEIRRSGLDLSEKYVSGRLRRAGERLGLESFGPSKKQTKWRSKGATSQAGPQAA